MPDRFFVRLIIIIILRTALQARQEDGIFARGYRSWNYE